MQFLSSNNRLFQRQSAYRKHHSCETALFNFADRWLKAMDCGHLVGTVFLDLSKVFDLIDYDVHHNGDSQLEQAKHEKLLRMEQEFELGRTN